MRKAQSAIEYLTSYGWMLFAVAAVSGGLLTTSMGNSCPGDIETSVSGPLKIQDAGVTSGNGMKILLENSDPERLEHVLKRVVLEDRENGETIRLETNRSIALGHESVVKLENVSRSDSCRNLDLRLTYDRGNFLKAQTVSARIKSRLKIKDGYVNETVPDAGGSTSFQVSSLGTSTPVAEGSTVEVNYSVTNAGDAGAERIVLRVDGNLERNISVVLSPGQTVQRSFDLIASQPGTHSYAVRTPSDSISGVFEVTSPSSIYTVDLNLLEGGTLYTNQTDIRVYSSGSVVDQRSVGDGGTKFRLSAGNYSINASADSHYNSSEKISLDSNTTVNLSLVKKPELRWLEVDDQGDSCHGFGCLFGGASSTAAYDFNWSVTDPAGTFSEVVISMNSTSASYGSLQGVRTVSEDGTYGELYDLRFRALYSNEEICRKTSDVSDQSGPGSFETC